MAHDYAWDTSGNGSIAPIVPAEAVFRSVNRLIYSFRNLSELSKFSQIKRAIGASTVLPSRTT